MKFPKQTAYFLVTAIMLLVTTSCSDTADINEFDQDEANLETNISDDIDITRKSENPILDCFSIPAPIDYLVTEYVITYEEDITESEKQVIRGKFRRYIYCIDTLYDLDNFNTELWVYKDCLSYPNISNCRPKNQKPEDPDIEDATEK